MSWIWLLNTLGAYLAVLFSGLLGGFTVFAYIAEESVSDYFQEYGCPVVEANNEIAQNPTNRIRY